MQSKYGTGKHTRCSGARLSEGFAVFREPILAIATNTLEVDDFVHSGC
jgi:hypothetical protein